MRNVNFQPLQRFATEDRVIDDSIVTFEVAKARMLAFSGR